MDRERRGARTELLGTHVSRAGTVKRNQQKRLRGAAREEGGRPGECGVWGKRMVNLLNIADDPRSS